jgi:hypothetical protein
MRSSSYGTYSNCQQKYFIEYVLGKKGPSNPKAEKGSIVHKVMEILAQIKICDGEIFTEDETSLIINPKNYDLEKIVEHCFDYYTDKSKHVWDWTNKDLKDCINWTNKVLTMSHGQYDPRNLPIVSPEIFFDFEINKEWAYYKYTLDNVELSGKLRMRGTVDLLLNHGDGIYEFVDYKTGSRNDWVTQELKDIHKLWKDPQLLIYNYAFKNKFPEIKTLIGTIIYINDGGGFSITYDDTHYELGERLIRDRFEKIKNNYKPKLKHPHFSCFNKKLCWWGTHNDKNEPVKWNEGSVCQTIKQEIQQIGLDRVTKNRAEDLTYSKYSGGGKDAKEITKT